MLRSVFSVLVSLGLMFISVTTHADFRRSENSVPDRYVVRLADDFPGSVKATAQMLGQQHGAKIVHVYETAIKGFSVVMPEAKAIALSRNPLIVSVTEDAEFFRADAQSNAPFGLDRIDQRDLPVSGTFWHDPNSGRYVKIFVIDSGVNFHNDFGGRVIERWNFVSQNGNVDPNDVADCTGHGTAVASVAAGATYGVAKAADIVSVRVFPCEGNGLVSDWIMGIDYVANRKWNAPWSPMVANMSFGLPTWPDVDDAVIRAVQYGVTVVVSAGNENRDVCNYSPAHLGSTTPGLITVTASDQLDQAAEYNRGACADLFAPGIGIRVAAGTTGEDIVNGTSFAAPHVAGAAARLLGYDGYREPPTVEDLIKQNATTGRIQNTNGSPNLLLYVAPPRTRPADADAEL